MTGVARIRTFTGRLVDVLNLQPEDISIRDIAHHLALANRFNGATVQPYSVAAHSLYMADHLVCPENALVGLMHDATEAYVGDMVKPLKDNIMDFKEIECKVWERIAHKYNLPVHYDAEVHEADRWSRVIETYYLQNGPIVDDIEGIQMYPLLNLDSWEKIEIEFLLRFLKLTNA